MSNSEDKNLRDIVDKAVTQEFLNLKEWFINEVLEGLKSNNNNNN